MGNNLPAAKFSIDTGAGVIDADYRGILYVLLFNLGDQDFEGSLPGSCTQRLQSVYISFSSQRGRSYCPVDHRTDLHSGNFCG